MVSVARRDFGRSIVFSAARGAGLIGLAVIVGIVLLQIVDDGTSGPANGGGGGGTVTSTPGETTATTPQGRDKSQVRVLVLNAGQAAGAAGNKANALRVAGYTILPASNSPLARTGVAVQCREDFDNEAATLAVDVAENATVEPFPDEPPAEAADADCIVLLGTA